MNNYHYICSTCNKLFDPDYIESNLIYLCPKCGSAERNKPLKGVLTVEYDYDSLPKMVRRDKLLQLQIGDYRGYEALLPVSSISDEINILLNPRVYPIQFDNQQILIFDDTLNPTLSFKDRATLLLCYKAMELGLTDISAASTGNAGSSLAGIAAKLGLSSHVFVPKRIPDAKRLQIQAFGAKLYIVDGTYDDAFDLCTEVSQSRGWYNRNTAFNPLTIEGKKTAAFDIFLATNGRLPDSIIVSVGDGVILAGIYKGFYDLKKLGIIDKVPHLVAVQAEGSNALVRYIKNDSFDFVETNTIADSIDAAAPRNLFLASEAIRNTAGLAIDVTDNEILEAQKILISRYGIMCEPSAAATLAGYIKMSLNSFEHYSQNTMLIISGNGLKDLKSLMTWNTNPDSKTFKEWKDMFKS